MSRWRLHPSLLFLAFSLAGLAALAALARRAEASAGFFQAIAKPDRNPSVTRERVLVIHDRQAEKEHIIRELRFRSASQPFGFLVPTPSRPEVAAVEGIPFRALESGFTTNHAGAKDTTPGLTVLDTSRVGRFTAFVLQANDSAALAKWLAEQGLAQGPDTASWLAHYAAMQFYFVALRLEPPGNADASTAEFSETIRISFSTPVAYYPYFEPPTLASVAGSPRTLELWFVGSDPVSPIALERRGSARNWIEPFNAVATHERARARLLASVPRLASFLPQGELFVQRFADGRSSRQGLGDVLFATALPTTPSPEQRARMRPLLAILDPELLPAMGRQAPTP